MTGGGAFRVPVDVIAQDGDIEPALVKEGTGRIEELDSQGAKILRQLTPPEELALMVAGEKVACPEKEDHSIAIGDGRWRGGIGVRNRVFFWTGDGLVPEEFPVRGSKAQRMQDLFFPIGRGEEDPVAHDDGG